MFPVSVRYFFITPRGWIEQSQTFVPTSRHLLYSVSSNVVKGRPLRDLPKSLSTSLRYVEQKMVVSEFPDIYVFVFVILFGFRFWCI